MGQRTLCSHRLCCLTNTDHKSANSLNFDLGVLRNLPPTGDFLAQKGRELIWGAAERVDTDGRNLVCELRIFERTPDLEVQLLHDALGRALRGNDPDPCRDAEARQSRFVKRRDIGRDASTAKTGEAE